MARQEVRTGWPNLRLKNLKKKYLEKHDGTEIKLLLCIVAVSVKVLVASWSQLLNAFVREGHRQTFQPVLHGVRCPLGHSSGCGRPKTSCGGNTSDNLLVKGRNKMENA